VSLQTWGTFSVRDHLAPRAFVADVVLYDKLVIPFPADATERARWGPWKPDELARKVEIMGDDLALTIPWTEQKHALFDHRISAASQLDEDAAKVAEWRAQGRDDWQITRELLCDVYGSQKDKELAAQVPRGAYVEAVAAYASYDAYREEVPVEEGVADGRVFGWEILVPEDSTLDDNALLTRAAKIARDPEFKAKRAALNEWRRELDKHDVSADAARADLEQRLAEYREAICREKVKTRVLNAFALLSIGASIAGALVFPPIAVAGGFIAAGSFGAGMIRASPPSDQAKTVAIIHDARRRFGW
jgi:hypothetical protein